MPAAASALDTAADSPLLAPAVFPEAAEALPECSRPAAQVVAFSLSAEYFCPPQSGSKPCHLVSYTLPPDLGHFLRLLSRSKPCHLGSYTLLGLISLEHLKGLMRPQRKQTLLLTEGPGCEGDSQSAAFAAR